MQTSQIFSLSILCESRATVFAFFENILKNPKQVSSTLSVFTPNPEQIVLAEKEMSFFKTLEKADYLLPDGIGLVYSSWLLHFFGKISQPIAERIAGVELVEHLLEIAKKQKQTTLIIGGRDYKGSYEGEFFEDEKSLVELKPKVYWTEAYQDKLEILGVEEEALEKIIRRLKPELVFVALGAPDQEEWIINHKKILDKNGVKISMAVGGSFDVLLNKVKRAPKFVRQLGLEWLWRLRQQPWRFKRQLRLIDFTIISVKEIFR